MTESKNITNSVEWDTARAQISNGMLSIIMPAYRLGSAIADNIARVHDLFSGEIPFEIIPVDDGSNDNTGDEIKRIAKELQNIHPVILDDNIGKGAAMRAGFQACSGSHILLLDGDLDLPPAQVANFFEIMAEKEVDTVIGSKRHPESKLNYPWHRKLMSDTYYLIVKSLIGLPVKDTQTGIKLFKRPVLEYVFPRMLVKRFAFDLEMLAIANQHGFKVAEAPITMDFSGGLGCARPRAIRNIMNDTLAIFYRIHILKYYQSIRDTHMATPPPLVSIVVAYPAPSEQLDECLAGIAKQKYINYEVILLPDFKHEPPTITDSSKTTIIPTGKIRPAQKRNIGIDAAKGEIVAFLDDDAFPTADWLQKAVVHFSDENIAALGGPATTPPSDSFMAKMSGRVYANKLVSGNYVYRYIPERVREIEDYPSCNLFVRTSALRQLNGFNTQFWPGEDTFLCMDIVDKLKKTIIYDPWVHAYHHRRQLFLPHLRQIGRYALHRGYFARKFPSTSRKLSYFIPSIFVIGLVAGAILSPFFMPCRILYLTVLGLYALLTFLASISTRPHIWIITWLGIMLTHIVYGARFLIGLLAYQMPTAVDNFDHPSEEK